MTELQNNKGIGRLTREQIEQIGAWRLQGYTFMEIAEATNYSFNAIRRLTSQAIIRGMIPKQCSDMALIRENRDLAKPLPKLEYRDWNTVKVSKFKVDLSKDISLQKRLNYLGWSYSTLAKKVAALTGEEARNIKSIVIKGVKDPNNVSHLRYKTIVMAMGGSPDPVWIDINLLD